MGILLVRLIDVINEYSEDSTFYSIAYTMILNFDNLQNHSNNDVANFYEQHPQNILLCLLSSA